MGSSVFTSLRKTRTPCSALRLPNSSGSGTLTVTGTCEPLAEVNIQGASQLSTICGQDSTFSIVIEKTVDGTYDFNISQRDLAGNTSIPTALRWVRSSNAIPPPVILSPASHPTVNSLDEISIAGNCQNGYEIILSGAASEQKTCIGNSFIFLVQASTDGVREYSITQGINGTVSDPATLQWIRDTQAPSVQIGSGPPATQLDKSSEFVFTASESNVQFQCKVDQGSFQACTCLTQHRPALGCLPPRCFLHRPTRC
jgi:hypothetical protein